MSADAPVAEVVAETTAVEEQVEVVAEAPVAAAEAVEEAVEAPVAAEEQPAADASAVAGVPVVAAATPEGVTFYVAGLLVLPDAETRLKAHFGGFGQVLSVHLVTDKLTGTLKGFGFVKMATLEVVDEILKTPQHNVSGVQIDVKRKTVNAERTEFKMFVGNITTEVSEDMLRTHFQPFGEILEVVVPRKPDESPRGFAFVKFASREGLQKAMSPGKHDVRGHELVVRAATDKSAAPRGGYMGGGRPPMMYAQQHMGGQHHLGPVHPGAYSYPSANPYGQQPNRSLGPRGAPHMGSPHMGMPQMGAPHMGAPPGYQMYQPTGQVGYGQQYGYGGQPRQARPPMGAAPY